MISRRLSSEVEIADVEEAKRLNIVSINVYLPLYNPSGCTEKLLSKLQLTPKLASLIYQF